MRSEENCSNTQIWPVSLSQNDIKLGKSRDHDHNLISSEGGQDISTCQFLKKMSGSGKFDLFRWVKILPTVWISKDDDQNLISSAGSQDIPACQISGHSKWLEQKLRFVVATINTKWKAQLKNLQFCPNPELMSSKPSKRYHHGKFQVAVIKTQIRNKL